MSYVGLKQLRRSSNKLHMTENNKACILIPLLSMPYNEATFKACFSTSIVDSSTEVYSPTVHVRVGRIHRRHEHIYVAKVNRFKSTT